MFKIVLLFMCALFSAQPQYWTLNTSNEGKLSEFQQLFQKYGYSLTSTKIDLDEIDSDPLTVVVHKASHIGENILIEDTSLDIEGADVGVNIRWLLNNLNTLEGRKATWRVLLAYRKDGQVFVYQGIVHGTIVQAKGTNGFGFDPVFLPNGQTETLAENKPDSVNARALAVEALIKNQPLAIKPVMTSWDGPWQKE